jgi:hypothetical protein
MQTVKSSNVDSVGYSSDTAELHVKFRNGSHYAYRCVGPEVIKHFLQTNSPGKFFAEHVRSKFSYFEVRRPEQT